MNYISKAKRETIELGAIPIEVFLLPSGEYRLSQTQVLEAVGVSKNWISELDKKNEKALEYLRGKGFSGSIEQVKIENEVKARQAKTLSIDDTTKVWGWFARKGNDLALDLLEVCAAEAIDRRADKAFDVRRTEEEYNKRMRNRIEGKITHRQLTDAIASYIERHPELSANARGWLYTNAAEAVNLAIFNRKAKRLAEELGADRDRLRDSFNSDELLYIREVEDTAVRIIDQLDINPVEAVKMSADRLLIPKQHRLAA
jgi:hypothetical protein